MAVARLLLAVGAALAAMPLGAAPTVPLQSGVAQPFQIGAGSYANDFYIDVPQGQTRLDVVIDTQGAQDLDLFLRYGSPFPDTTTDGLPLYPEYVYEYAQYRSTSAEGDERLALGPYNAFPVRAGRWYVAIVNFSGQSANASITATSGSGEIPGLPIELVLDDPSDDCDISGWNDGTARAAIGGNSGSTLGQQRRNAIAEAARLLSTQLRSPVPIRVQACWRNLGTGDSVTLANAGPVYIFARDNVLGASGENEGPDIEFMSRWLPRSYTWYSSAPNTKLAGARLCGVIGGPCTSYDVRANFNTQIDTPSALGERSFYYGFQPAAPNTQQAGDTDFIAVAMHEIAHGLGFIGLTNTRAEEGPLGERLLGYDDIYGANLVKITGDGFDNPYVVTPYLEGSDAERAAALVSNSGLRWSHPEANASTQNTLRTLTPPDNYIRIYAPNPISPGSTLSHIIGATADAGLMLPQALGSQRQLGLAQPMLHAMGWSSAAVTPPARIAPFSAQYFDPARPGHGIDFSYVGGNVYALIFYTYGAAGEPEWYIAIGPMEDGVFMPANNANGDSLVRYRYVPGGNPPQQADASVSGQVRLDFRDAGIGNACRDGVARSGTLAVMTWSIGADRNQQWCMQPLVPDANRLAPDFTGGWFAGAADAGWGFSFTNFGLGGSNGLFGLLYYPDVNGAGRWAYVQTTSFASGNSYSLVERRGYCRTCAVPPGVLQGVFDDRPAGTVTLTLTQPSADATAGNRANFTVTYQTAPGGSFNRDTALQLLTSPSPPPP